MPDLYSSSVDSQAPGTVLVVPGSSYQVPLLHKVRTRGYWVVCADRDPHCACSTLANEFHVIGLDERERLLELAHAVQPVAIITDQTDSGVMVVAWLSEQLGLRGIGTVCARLFTDKHSMREFGCSLGLPAPAFQLCHGVDSALAAARVIGFPVVLKPPGNQSSRGVFCVDDAAQLYARFADAQLFSGNGGVLVEQFIGGTEFTVEGVMTNAGHVTLGISEKAHYQFAPMVACRLCYTPDNNRFDYATLRAVHDQWINKSGLPFGLTHAEYKCYNGQFYLIETAARGGGSRIASDIVPWLSGVDYQQLLLDEVLTGTAISPRYDELANRCALLEFFDFAPGRVLAINGVEAAAALPGVLTIRLLFDVGDDIEPVTDDTNRPGVFILLTDTESELIALREKVLGLIQVAVDTSLHPS